MDQQLDFLAIGDMVTDAFIKLSEAHLEEKGGKVDLCMSFGDKLPFDSVKVVPAVGNSPNAAVSAHRLGLKSAILTNIGDDGYGKEMLEALKAGGIQTDYVRVHEGQGSNYHYVLRYKAERTILVKHYEYEYTMPDITPGPKWLYLSSLAENSLPYHMEIADYLDRHPETKLAFQPGTFQMKLGYETLKRLYEKSEVFFCNKEEAQKITGNNSTDIIELLKSVRGLGPKIAVITDGPNGAHTYDGTEVWYCPMYPDPAPPVDRTGAGDSFSSTFTVALILGKSLKEALMWGPINSMSVVQKIGAQEGLLTIEQLEKFLAEKPADYEAKKIA
ncbi:MAG: carbohydrate kinase family protein [Candidatus Paceibacterota bacterium]